MSVRTTSSQSAALVELDISAVSLPPGLLGAGEAAAPNPFREERDINSRYYRDLVTTHVYTVPPQEGACVRLPTPTRPSTARSPGFRVREEAGRRACSARPIRNFATAPGKTPPPRRCPIPGNLVAAREAKSAPGVRKPRPASKTTGEPVAASSVVETLSKGVHPRVDGKLQYPWRALYAATGRIGRWVGRSPPPDSAAIQADRIRRWDDGERRPLTATTCVLSAPARGVNIRRAVEECCNSLPPVPKVSQGARRFLQQWDRSSRARRERILTALTDQLLLVAGDARRPGPGSTRRTDLVQSGSLENSINRKNAEGYYQRGKARLADSPYATMDLHPMPFTTRDERLPGSGHGVSSGDANRTNVVATAVADDATIKHTVKDEGVVGTASPGFLELLGPHAGLFMTRIYSYLQVSYACGREIGPCLRVAALLAGAAATTTAAAQGGPDAIGGEVSSKIEPHLSTPRIIQIALDILAADDMLQEESGVASSAPQGSRVEAFHLLLAIIRAGGRYIKEGLTCQRPLSRSSPRKYWGDAVGSTMIALRERECSTEARTAAGHLLVELGTENPAGSAQVWNAVLCLLDQGEGPDLQIVGCRVAADLLATAQSSPRSSDEVQEGNARGCSPSTRRRCVIRPELVVIPSVLRLALLSSCFGVREASGDVAAVLTTQQGPCFYLMAASLVGFLGRFSGVDRGAPASWIPQNLSMTSRGSMSAIGGGVTDDRRGGLEDFDVEGVRGTGDGKPCGFLQINRSTDGVEPTATRAGTISSTIDSSSSSKTGRSIDDVSLSGDNESRGKVDVDAEENVPKDMIEGLEQARPCRRKADENVDFLTRPLELLRRICAGSGQDHEVRPALASTRAPLAILDLIVASAPSAAGLSLDMAKEKEPALLVLSDDEKIFVTQTGRPIGARRCVSESGRLANSTPRRDLDPNNSEILLRSNATPTPPSRLCRAVAEALLEMYRRGGGLFLRAHPNNGEISGGSGRDEVQSMLRSDVSEGLPTGYKALDLGGIINAAVEGCMGLSCSLRNGDSAGLAEIFSGHSDGADGHAEIATLRKNVFALTRHLGRVRPPSPASGIIASSYESELMQHQSLFHDDGIGKGNITVGAAENVANVDQSSGRRNVAESRRRSDQEGIQGVSWYHHEALETTTHPGLKGPTFTEKTGGFPTAEKSRAAYCAPSTLARREVHNIVLLLLRPPAQKRKRFLPYATSSLARRRRSFPCPRWSAPAGTRKTATAGFSVAKNKVRGPRVWGPEDWGEDSPTMAMLTTPIAREQKPPNMVAEGNATPGPIWQAIFGGGRDAPQPSSTSPAGIPFPHHEGKSTISDVARQNPSPVQSPKGSGETISLIREAPDPAVHEAVDEMADVAKVLLVDGSGKGASIPPVVEWKRRQHCPTKWPSSRSVAPGRRNMIASAATSCTPKKAPAGRPRPRASGGDSRGDRMEPGAKGLTRKGGRNRRDDSMVATTSLLGQCAEVATNSCSRGDMRSTRQKSCNGYQGMVQEHQATKAQGPLLDIQGSEISRDAFEVAERYATTTAVGV